jgi:hypothetical protein
VAEAVADMLFRFGADISDLKSKVDEANARLNKMGAEAKRAHRDNREGFESLRGPMSEIGRLTNALGEAFGEANTKATKMVRELVEGIGTGSVAVLGAAALGALVTTLISKFQEAGEAAKKAAEADKDARTEQNRKIQETIDKLDEEIKKRNILLRGENPTFAAAQETATKTSDELGLRQQELTAGKGAEEQLRAQLASILRERNEAVADAARPAQAAAVSAVYKARIDELSKEIEAAEKVNLDLDGKVRKLTEAAKKARENVAGSAVSDLSTPITPETLTPPSETTAEHKKGDEAAKAGRVKLLQDLNETAQKYAQDRAAVADIINQGSEDRAVAAFEERQNKILALGTEFDGIRSQLVLANEQKLQDELAAIQAEATQRALQPGKAQAKAQRDAATEAQQQTQQLVSITEGFGSAIADLLITPLIDGFASLADFAKAAQRLVLGLVADLLKAVVVADHPLGALRRHPRCARWDRRHHRRHRQGARAQAASLRVVPCRGATPCRRCWSPASSSCRSPRSRSTAFGSSRASGAGAWASLTAGWCPAAPRAAGPRSSARPSTRQRSLGTPGESRARRRGGSTTGREHSCARRFAGAWADGRHLPGDPPEPAHGADGGRGDRGLRVLERQPDRRHPRAGVALERHGELVPAPRGSRRRGAGDGWVGRASSTWCRSRRRARHPGADRRLAGRRGVDDPGQLPGQRPRRRRDAGQLRAALPALHGAALERNEPDRRGPLLRRRPRRPPAVLLAAEADPGPRRGEERTEGGATLAGRLRSYREVIGLNFSILTEDEHQLLADIEDASSGEFSPIVLIPTTSKPGEIFHGRFEDPQTWARNPGAVFYEGHALAFRESGRAL